MSQQTRTETSRTSEQRPAIGGPPRGRLDVDQTGLPEGMELRWVRESTLGQPDYENIEDALDRGLEFATTEMLPNMRRRHTIPGRPDPEDNHIRRGANILMVGRKADLTAERDHNVAMAEAQVQASQHIANDKGAQLDKDVYERSRVDAGFERGRPRGRPQLDKDA